MQSIYSTCFKKSFKLLLESAKVKTEGLITAVQGKGYMVNAQDGNMLKEQHMRKVEEGLMQAIQSARIARLSQNELIETLKLLLTLKEN